MSNENVIKNERQASKETKEKKAESTINGLIVTSPGSRMASVYKRQYNKDIDKSLVVKVDETDLYEFIQASASQTDLALLQKRFVELGEIPSVDDSLGSNDLTKYPANIHELYDFVNDVNGNFTKLPESVQKIFGTSEAYYKAIVNGTYESTLVAALKAAQAPKEEKKPEEKKEGN